MLNSVRHLLGGSCIYRGKLLYLSAVLLLSQLLPYSARVAVADVGDPTDPEASLQIVVEAEQVRISGVSLGGSVAVIGAMHRTEDFHASLTFVREVLVDDDQDGEVVLKTKPAPLSVWLAASLDEGIYGIATSDPDFQPQALASPPLISGPTENELHFEGLDEIEGVLVRHGVGAWAISGIDAGQGESLPDPDGDVDLDVAGLALLAGQGSVNTLMASDFIIAIEPKSMSWIVSNMSAGLQP